MNRTDLLRLTVIVGALLIGIWLPFRLIGFVPSLALEITFNLLVSVVAMISIFLYFRDARENPEELRSWLRVGLILDLLCILPMSLVAVLFLGEPPIWILLVNLFACRHIGHVRLLLDRFDSLSPITYRLAPLVLFLPLLVHMIACGWIALGSGTAGPESDQVLMYVKAFYWTFTTLTTVGYGDISAKSIPQMLYTCGIQVIGVGVFGFILSNVAGILARSDAAREHHMDSLDKIETFMNLHKIPPQLRARIRGYYHYMWTNKKGYHDETLLEGLPTKIQSELFAHINKPIIEKVPFLRGAEPELIDDLMSELKPRIFVPGERVFKVDEHGDALYFIQSGNVDIISREGKILACLGDGAFFGEMALISDQPRTATVTANSFCDVYSLRRDAFDRVTTAYPQFRLHIEEIMEERRKSQKNA